MPSPIAGGVVPWPDDVAELYVQAGYWQGRSLGDLLWAQADLTPNRMAVADGQTQLTYSELVQRADAAATRLASLGVRAGDRILVQLPNGWEFVVLTLACLRAGIVPVMALPGHRRHELGHLADHAEAVAIAVPDTFRGFDHQALAAQLVDEVDSLQHVLVSGTSVAEDHVDLRTLLEPSRAPTDDRRRWDEDQPGSREVAVFLLSGGTTGLPKLIARTHDDYAYNAICSGEVSGFDQDTVYLVVLPAGHNFPLACPGILGALLVGGSVVLLDSPETQRAFAAIGRHGVTHVAVVPAVAQTWIDHQTENRSDEIASLRVLQVGGARLAEEVARKVRPVLGCTLQQVFGMAEGLLNYTRLDDPEEVVVGTQGRPISAGDEVLLVDANDAPTRDGETGSLVTRGPYTPRGYYRAVEHNLRSFTPDGWYRSGDVCRWHPSGNLVVEGRDKDMINRGGEKISAEEVENLAYLVPQIAQVAAVAMPDPVLGERVCLYAVARPGASVTLEQVREAMRERDVASYKLPDRLVMVDEIPSTKVGKIDKSALRADIADRIEGEHGLSVH
jgi:2,3-dihydroxybenzoate-AMP ligase